MRVRKKLIVLHTTFSLCLAAVLLLSLQPAVSRVIARAEAGEAARLLKAAIAAGWTPGNGPLRVDDDLGGVRDITGNDADPLAARAARALQHPSRTPGQIVELGSYEGGNAAAVVHQDRLLVASIRNPEARRAGIIVYLLTAVALVGVYALIAIALEVLVLPRQVYGPISALLRADQAVQAGDTRHELIDDAEIPADELGEIMRSRNRSVIEMRSNERRLAGALEELETVATDLRRKNHQLATARRNLEGADRLASLGMMSAGIAHEMNTPLSVAKGLVERLAKAPAQGMPEHEAALLARVIARLETLSDSLLDFARARSPDATPVALHELAAEAITLVSLDRDVMPAGQRVRIANDIDRGVVAACDHDRMLQVLVNLVRNAVQAVGEDSASGPGSGEVRLTSQRTERDAAAWVHVLITDTGPGIDPAALPSLFDPFVSTRLDARGTGLGLAVAEGIVREHGGVLLARNREGLPGAVFEVMLPTDRPPAPTHNSPDAGSSDPPQPDATAHKTTDHTHDR
ncbi:MAG: ATP-binding protein [Planctomycetota bacterium]